MPSPKPSATNPSANGAAAASATSGYAPTARTDHEPRPIPHPSKRARPYLRPLLQRLAPAKRRQPQRPPLPVRLSRQRQRSPLLPPRPGHPRPSVAAAKTNPNAGKPYPSGYKPWMPASSPPSPPNAPPLAAPAPAPTRTPKTSRSSSYLPP